jgi:hypothetical protein
MTTFRSENVLVGLIAGALVPWIGWRVARAVRERRLPIGRGYVSRDERAGAYWVLCGFYTAAAVMAAVICADLIFGVKL